MQPFRHLTRSAVALAAALAASLAVLLATTVPAQAFTTYTPTGGPAVRLVGSGITFTNIAVGETFSCPTFDLTGSVISPGVSRAYGLPATTLTSVTSSCTPHPLCAPVVVATTVPWYLAITGDASAGTWPARITTVKIQLSCGACQITLDGSVNGRFNAATQVFKPDTGPSGLVQSGNNGHVLCTVLDLQNGDDYAVGGSWTNVPPSGSAGLAITNP
ncbi:hypothetical protein [Pimelobacter simplex]|uniref:hypothetical protein n=1 Tax=Nocardioides simplex TaxID=2045 RepID=UPI0021504CB6|nr:hypothetical protein [Pimelobacter simplex]UUW91123.1 hypothetical protein M0M43_06470 [Pimelobacter simplex]UUW94951.1 hypothetical protein M0M48_24975 [Pimelobacter simplex]